MFVLSVFPTERVGSDENGDGREDTWTVFEEGKRKAVYYDSNFDGNINYAHIFDKDGLMIEERLDFNHDGHMDDFYFYDEGVLIRREIDTNFDGKIDVWVHLEEGVYIRRYEQDLNFDGKIDKVKDFSEK
jgi:hypothetical protein